MGCACKVATLVAVYAAVSFASISGVGWRWAGVIWLYSLVSYLPLDLIKVAVRYALSGEAWSLLFDGKVRTAHRRPAQAPFMSAPVQTSFSSDCIYKEEGLLRRGGSEGSGEVGAVDAAGAL